MSRLLKSLLILAVVAAPLTMGQTQAKADPTAASASFSGCRPGIARPYVWAYSPYLLPSMVPYGYLRIGRPMYRYVPEACGFAWMQYIAHCY